MSNSLLLDISNSWIDLAKLISYGSNSYTSEVHQYVGCLTYYLMSKETFKSFFNMFLYVSKAFSSYNQEGKFGPG